VDNQRNIILAVLLTALILFGWDAGVRYFYPQADKPKVAATARLRQPRRADARSRASRRAKAG
jgi:YidC/Oxa1 family membrane protein insertase